MRLAHLILVHNNPEQLERLIKRIGYSSSDIYIHIDAKSDSVNFEYLKSIPNIYFIKKRLSVGWGNYSMVAATLNSMKEILDTQINYSHINLISGQDYLLKRIEDIEQFFFANTDKSYIQYLSINEEWKEAKSRLTKYNLGDLSFPFKYRIQSFINHFLPNRKIPDGLEPYGSSQWLTITPNCVRYVLKFLTEKPKTLNFFKWTWAVDEILFQTILLNSPFKLSIINDNKRYIKFENNEVNPKLLTVADADNLLKSDKFFARKFSIHIDSHILDLIDNSIGLT